MQGKYIKSNSKPLDFSKYSENHGVIQGNLNSLRDIAELGDSLLNYPIGSAIEMVLFNIILQTKAEIHEVKPEKDIQIGTNMPLSGEFIVTAAIEEENNVYSKIKISNYRTFELTGKPSELTSEVAKLTEARFKSISQLVL